MPILYMICRPADPKDNLNQGIEIYTLGGKKYVDLGLSENKADAVKKAGELKFKTLRMAKIDFADPNNLTAKGQHKLICWEFICDK